MRKLFFLATLVCMLSCSKDTNQKALPMQRTDFFKNEKDLFQKTQTALDILKLDQKLEAIENISYIDSKNKSFAFVFYRSDKGNSNVVIQREVVGENQVLVSTTKCEGTSCDCKVKTTIHNNGDVTMECTCSSCTMMTTGFDEP